MIDMAWQGQPCTAEISYEPESREYHGNPGSRSEWHPEKIEVNHKADLYLHRLLSGIKNDFEYYKIQYYRKLMSLGSGIKRNWLSKFTSIIDL